MHKIFSRMIKKFCTLKKCRKRRSLEDVPSYSTRDLGTWQYHDETLWHGYWKRVPFCQRQRLTFRNVFRDNSFPDRAFVPSRVLAFILNRSFKGESFSWIHSSFLFFSQRQHKWIELNELFDWCIFFLFSFFCYRDVWKNLIASSPSFC